MKITLFLLTFILFSCGRVYNTSTLDEQQYGSEIEGTPNFKLAQMVVLNKCVSCHGSWAKYTEEDYIDEGLVSVGQPNNSEIYKRIRGNDSPTAGDMPTNGTTLTSFEINQIKIWISDL